MCHTRPIVFYVRESASIDDVTHVTLPMWHPACHNVCHML